MTKTILPNALTSLLAKGVKNHLRAEGCQVSHSQVMTGIAKALGFDSANAMRALAEAGEDPRPAADPNKARLWKTTYLLEVLAGETPARSEDLDEIARETDEGPWVADLRLARIDPLTPEEMRAALKQAGNDGTFFDDPDQDEADRPGESRQESLHDLVQRAERRGLTALQNEDGWIWQAPGGKSSADRFRTRTSAMADAARRYADPERLRAYLVEVEFRSDVDDGAHAYHQDAFALAAPTRRAAALAAERFAMEDPAYDARVRPRLCSDVTGASDVGRDALKDMLDDALSDALVAFLEAEIRNEDFGGERPATLSSAYGSLQQMDPSTLRELNPRLREMNPDRERLLAEIEAHLALGRRDAPLRHLIDWD